MSDNFQHWHLDKRLNVGHILTTISAVAAAFAWGSTIESRLAVLELQTRNSEAAQAEIKEEIVRTRQSFNQRLDRVDSKLDRLIERKK